MALMRYRVPGWTSGHRSRVKPRRHTFKERSESILAGGLGKKWVWSVGSIGRDARGKEAGGA
eukprot:3049711-Amphidinium_carterae.1